VEYNRLLHRRGDCGSHFSAVDEELGVRPGRDLTPSLVRRVAYGAATHSMLDAAKDLKEYLDVEVSPAEFERVFIEKGTCLDRVQRAEEQGWRQPVDPLRETPAPQWPTERLIVEADATCVLTIQGEEHKSVYCGRVFGAEDRVEKEGSGRRQIARSLYTGSAVNMEDFGERLKALTWRAGMRSARGVAFLGDGAPCLWKWAQENLPPGTLFIQDFWHVDERLSNLAKDVFGSTWQAHHDRWVEELAGSRVQAILDELQALQRQRRGKARDRLTEEIGYLEKGKHRMDYVRYRALGWPIGSGAVEGTCKHLVKECFCLTGAHWKRANIPQMLALRLAIFNNEWESVWQNAQVA